MAETRADRLSRLLLRALPNLVDALRSGQWSEGRAPYRFTTKNDGRVQLVIDDPETGSRFGFVGKDQDDVLDQFEKRLGA